MNHRPVRRPTRITIIRAIEAIARREGPLPVRDIKNNLWDMGICVSVDQIVSALTCSEGRGIFAYRSKTTKGNHAIQRYYYLTDQGTD